MNPHLHISELIAAHRVAVVADEAAFDADGKAIDAIQAEKTSAKEHAAFMLRSLDLEKPTDNVSAAPRGLSACACEEVA